MWAFVLQSNYVFPTYLLGVSTYKNIYLLQYIFVKILLVLQIIQNMLKKSLNGCINTLMFL